MSIECTEFNSYKNGALVGFANFKLPIMGVEIYGCAVFSKNGKRWVTLPTKEYKDADSQERKFSSVIRFIQKDHLAMFSRRALDALDEWCLDQSKNENNQTSTYKDKEVHF
jgi:hypothetical protein